MRRPVLLVVLVVGALLVPAVAPAYPPITCGRTKLNGRVYVVRTHGPSCPFARHWVRKFGRRHRAPKGFRCRSYGKPVPVNCINRKHRTSYFQATAASR